MSAAIHLENVSKLYRLGSTRTSLRESLSNATQRLLSSEPAPSAQTIWALRDVSFSVQPGEALGLIGPNGAGKTTTLKLLSRVSQPTQGAIYTQGRMASLIELGAGFHPELTGRENIFLNGAILGLSQREIQSKFDTIVNFSELEEFIDTPIKRYSSGMYARLGFSVAAFVDPEILLIDEVLAVGDMNFQRKCFDFIHNFVNSGHTTIFVSHNLFALEQLCDRIVWLEKGHVMADGITHQVLSAYMHSQEEKLLQIEQTKGTLDSFLIIESVSLTNSRGEETQEFESGEDICVHLHYSAPQPIRKPHFVLAVWDGATHQPVFIASMLVDNEAPDRIEGQGTITCLFEKPPLRPRAYQVFSEIWQEDLQNYFLIWQPLIGFTIKEDSTIAYHKGSLRHGRVDAPIAVPYKWIINSNNKI